MNEEFDPPFPNGTFSLEGISFNNPLPPWLTMHPSCNLAPLREVRNAVDGYLRGFPQRETAPTLGHCYVLNGEHGTGKTHTLGVVLRGILMQGYSSVGKQREGRAAPLFFTGRRMTPISRACSTNWLPT